VHHQRVSDLIEDCNTRSVRARVSTPTRRAGRARTRPGTLPRPLVGLFAPGVGGGTRPCSAFPSGGSGTSRSDEPVPRPPGRLSDDQHADALVMAGVAAQTVSPCRQRTLGHRGTESKPVPTFTSSSTRLRHGGTQLRVRVGEASFDSGPMPSAMVWGSMRWLKRSWPDSCASICRSSRGAVALAPL